MLRDAGYYQFQFVLRDGPFALYLAQKRFVASYLLLCAGYLFIQCLYRGLHSLCPQSRRDEAEERNQYQ